MISPALFTVKPLKVVVLVPANRLRRCSRERDGPTVIREGAVCLSTAPHGETICRGSDERTTRDGEITTNRGGTRERERPGTSRRQSTGATNRSINKDGETIRVKTSGPAEHKWDVNLDWRYCRVPAEYHRQTQIDCCCSRRRVRYWTLRATHQLARSQYPRIGRSRLTVPVLRSKTVVAQHCTADSSSALTTTEHAPAPVFRTAPVKAIDAPVISMPPLTVPSFASVRLPVPVTPFATRNGDAPESAVLRSVRPVPSS